MLNFGGVCFIFSPKIGEVIHFDYIYFSDGLKPPTSFPSKISGFKTNMQHLELGRQMWMRNRDEKKGGGPFIGAPEKLHFELEGAHLVGGGLKFVFMFIPIPGQMIHI